MRGEKMSIKGSSENCIYLEIRADDQRRYHIHGQVFRHESGHDSWRKHFIENFPADVVGNVSVDDWCVRIKPGEEADVHIIDQKLHTALRSALDWDEFSTPLILISVSPDNEVLKSTLIE